MNIAVENHYEILGISPDVDDDAVKQAFRELAKSYHPDYNPGNDEAERRFKQVNIAYEALKDEARRHAYNEFLAFAVRRKNFRRVQWGRLAALLFVLLLGPSAVMFWLAVPRDISVVQSPVEPPTPAPAQNPKAEPAPKPQAAAPKGELAPKPQAAAPREAPAAQQKESARAGRVEPAPASPPAIAAREPAAKPEAAPPPEPAKDERAKAATEANETARQSTRRFEVFLKDKPAEGDVTHAVPKDQQVPKPGVDQPAAGNAVPPPEGATKPDGSARGAARLLAELKEPGNASVYPAPTTGTPPTPNVVEAPVPRNLASRPEGSDTEPFTDCPTCPAMSLTRRTTPARRGGDLAVSLSEVTVRQWNDCVEDRICAPYRSVDGGDPASPVVGLSERAASQYTRWLSQITGHPYSVVMPLTAPVRRQQGDDCVDRGLRRPDGGWDWLEDQSPRDCPPSVARNVREKPQGFRVARRVIKDG